MSGRIHLLSPKDSIENGWIHGQCYIFYRIILSSFQDRWPSSLFHLGLKALTIS